MPRKMNWVWLFLIVSGAIQIACMSFGIVLLSKPRTTADRTSASSYTGNNMHPRNPLSRESSFSKHKAFAYTDSSRRSNHKCLYQTQTIRPLNNTVFKGSHNDDNDKCGPHGSLLVTRCICDATYAGEYCQDTDINATLSYTRRFPECRHLVVSDGWSIGQQRHHQGMMDRCWNTRFGRLRIVDGVPETSASSVVASSSSSSSSRWNAAHLCETHFWQNPHHIKPERNPHQLAGFQQFRTLPQSLGHVIEYGAGPYTKLRLILEEGDRNRSVTSVTLVDPLLEEYRSNPNISTSYDATTGALVLHNGQECIPTWTASFPAEQPLPLSHRSFYDTAILINTLEHCSNAVSILHNIYTSLKPGGLLLYGEEYASAAQLQTNDPCHPIRITKEFHELYLTTYYDYDDRGNNSFVMPPTDGNDIAEIPESAGGAKTSLYAIVQKPRLGRET